MSADVFGWLALGCAVAVVGYVLGYVAGRDGAERLAHATIADLRIALRHARGDRYLTDDDRRPL